MADMTDWQALRDAYGSAELVGSLLDRGDTDERAVWEELWSRLCHQGTVYTASYAALPRLAELATRRDPSGFVEPLFLATCIIASTDGPETDVEVRTRYADTIRVLHEVAERLVPLAGDDTDFLYRVQALLATEGGGKWSSRLDALADRDVTLQAPDGSTRDAHAVGIADDGALRLRIDDRDERVHSGDVSVRIA